MIKYPGDNSLAKIFQLIKSKFDGLAKVASTGSYKDLTDKPDIGGIVSRSSISISEDGTSVINIPIEISDTNTLAVYQNGLLLTPDIHYTATTTSITLINYTANANDIFTFVSSVDTGSTVPGGPSNITASQVSFEDTTEDGIYNNCPTVQDALIHAANFRSDIKGISVNGNKVTPSSEGVADIPVPSVPVKSIALNGTVISADANGKVDITGVIKSISVNGTTLSVDSSGKVAINGLVKTISVNGTTLSTDSSGNVNINGLVKNISVNGTTITTDSSGNVALTGLVKNITLNGTTLTTDSSGNVSITGLAKTILVNGTEFNADTSGKISITGLVKSLSLNGNSYSPDSSGLLTLNNIMKTDSDQSMSAKLIAQNNTDYATKQVRNIFLVAKSASNNLPTGSSGDICIIYKDS